MNTGTEKPLERRIPRRVLVLILIAIPWFGWNIHQDNKEHDKRREYIRGLHLKMTGEVRYVIPATSANGTGILGIKVIRSNIAEYDKSDSSHYFCTIKGRNAELYTSTHDVGIGDLIELNSDTEEMIFFKPDGKTDVVEMKLYSSDRFYENFVRKNSKL